MNSCGSQWHRSPFHVSLQPRLNTQETSETLRAFLNHKKYWIQVLEGHFLFISIQRAPTALTNCLRFSFFPHFLSSQQRVGTLWSTLFILLFNSSRRRGSGALQPSVKRDSKRRLLFFQSIWNLDWLYFHRDRYNKQILLFSFIYQLDSSGILKTF